jgi:CelD/BcsL family acetyltransferase involved in cellulose biosynthesis
MTWLLDWITNWDDVWSEDFLARWQRWMQESSTSHVFSHPTLVRAWVETYLPLRRIEPRFLVATREDSTIFLPLVLWRKNWKNAFQRVLVPVGYSDFDYHDPILVGRNDEAVWREFWDEFVQEVCNAWRKEYDAVDLPGVHPAFACSERFGDQGDVCLWRDLRAFKDGEAFLGSLSKSLRGDIRRQERRMSEIGPVTYTVFPAHDTEAALEALEEFLPVHAERWPAAYKAPGFHRALVKSGLASGVLHFSTLRIGDDVAAWHLGFVDASRFYYYMPVHKPQYAHLSPGKILLYYCIRDAIQRRLRVFDHLRGGEDYKSGWTDRAEGLHRMQIEKGGLLSGLRNSAAERCKPAMVKALGCWR